ncbi:chromosome segregation protein [Virgibacillus natechei]|uniref:Chromosome partition protein Smc n=1 Tax=Virgibacillus natechei TaxID=1216297 RepID=A0ABS4IB26_9BACI|nr:chromosome segregation protein SMC [Virgibacillus natechei]MBP1968131.1 chromosome segregation protein [Virgibacillus natechei]UZD14590.1 chromosome segregation protein SMC [Virgibacillus natechei]
MYLKRLESVGFKSFAERINVEFVPGVTAVVGPNGSGKSNITDAIRWVLGEQSARSLRGSVMEDIIFQGSDTRKPLNVAEVTLVLDNQDDALPLDYKEISVTRRVYRSGDSEFYINKQACRLKDIVDLFMDSGLGRESFSIISQGKVEEILSSKAEERRAIFEEAAGVLKYKQRKKKAEYKLAETQENLNRVEDIIYEIEQQIDPLEQQAKTAKKYIALKEQLKQNEITLLVTEIEGLHKEWEVLLNELEKEKKDEIKLKTFIQQKEAGLEKERQEVHNLDESIEKLQTSLLATTEELERFEGKKQLLHERTKHFAENKQKLETQRNDTIAQIEALKDERSNEKQKLTELQAIKQKTKQNVEQLEEKLLIDKENIAEKIEDRKSEYIEYLNSQAAKRNEKQSIQQQLQQLSGKKGKQEEKFRDVLDLRKELNENLDKTQADFMSEEEHYRKKNMLIKQLKEDLEYERNQFQELQTKLYQGYQHIEKLRSRKEMLEEMKEDFQGFFHGVKAVLKAREENTLTRIHGAVIELVDVPQDYITAIETALGGQAQHIVVNDDEAGRRAITWLKKTNNGRATFLPLGSIKERFITKDVLKQIENHDGFVGIAANLVKTDATYQTAVTHLLGHIVIANTLKDANEIAKLAMRRYRIVTLDGDVVNPGGAMSGGAKKKTNQSLFTREKDLEDISEKLNEFVSRTTTFEQKVDKQKQKIIDIEKNLEAEERSIVSTQHALDEKRSAYKEVEMKIASFNDNLALYDQETKQFGQDIQELESRDELLNQALDEIKNKLVTVQEEINILTNQEAAFKETKEQLQSDLHDNRVTLAEQEEREKNQREKTNAVQKQLVEQEEKYEAYSSDLHALIQTNEMEETEAEIDQTIHAKKNEKAELTNSIQAKRSNRLERTKLIQDQERELKEESKKHQDFLQAIQQKEVKANRFDVELENHLSHLQNEYTITFEKAKQTYNKSDDMGETKNIVEQLKYRIEQLGTVNTGSIDEYERISERYTFLDEQRNDLVEAKQTLYAVIGEMDEEMKKRFEEIFTQVKGEFQVVFQELFGGGHADLKLTDPNNLLDTGVDIVAQPPGKKLQHLGLLSGGERALTAIALLFSILRVRPVPFCVLDEVESALDEANVTRFAKYVKMHSKNTQFIVITHRKGTMEETDVLYGVTMQESGVSRLVSVRLEETKELIQS